MFGSVTELDLLERVAFWLNTRQRAARANPEFIELLVPVPGTTCHFMHADGTRALAAIMRDSCYGIIYHDMIL